MLLQPKHFCPVSLQLKHHYALNISVQYNRDILSGWFGPKKPVASLLAPSFCLKKEQPCGVGLWSAQDAEEKLMVVTNRLIGVGLLDPMLAW